MNALDTMRLPIVAAPARVRPYVRNHQRRTSFRLVAAYFGNLRRQHQRRANEHLAGRDQHGSIRMNNGTGLLLAGPAATRTDLLSWRLMATDATRLAQYDAALALLDREETSRA